jgi:hypothetical protein
MTDDDRDRFSMSHSDYNQPSLRIVVVPIRKLQSGGAHRQRTYRNHGGASGARHLQCRQLGSDTHGSPGERRGSVFRLGLSRIADLGARADIAGSFRSCLRRSRWPPTSPSIPRVGAASSSASIIRRRPLSTAIRTCRWSIKLRHGAQSNRQSLRGPRRSPPYAALVQGEPTADHGRGGRPLGGEAID